MAFLARAVKKLLPIHLVTSTADQMATFAAQWNASGRSRFAGTLLKGGILTDPCHFQVNDVTAQADKWILTIARS